MESGRAKAPVDVRKVMRKFFYLIILGTAATIGCSSAAGPKTNVTVSTNSANSTVATMPVDGAPQTVLADSTAVPADPAGVADQPGVTAISPKLNQQGRLLDTPGKIPEPQRMPAGENSEFATTMDKQGNFLEMRYFKNHPAIVKVERTLYGPNDSSLKIWLKGGKVVTASGNGIENLTAESSLTFMKLAGIQPKVAPPGATGAKTDGKQ